MGKKQVSRAASMLLVSSLLFAVPSVRCEAAVITSNATDKIAVAFHAGTDYSAGDYVIYDAELYICTQETKGEWETVQADFMQITKNRELGTGKDLSLSYQDSKDPTEETSLMAFVANAWQKMKSFFGIGEADSATDGQDYKRASVSAKLNYLKDQGSTMDAELSDLKGSASDLKGSVSELKGSVSDLKGNIERSFQSVSSGKQKLTDAITDGGGTASPSYNFDQFSQAITALAAAQRASGETAGHAKGYEEGRASGLAEGRTQGLEEGKSQGTEEGKAQGREEGIREADGRVNTESASYKQGFSDAGYQMYHQTIKLNYHGPQSEKNCFRRNWTGIDGAYCYYFEKSFSGQIYGVWARNDSSIKGTHYETVHSIVNMDGEMRIVREQKEEDDFHDTLKVNGNMISWDPFVYNSIDPDRSMTTLELIVYYR